jgi:uncharacterized membrane protein YfcA
LIPLDFSLPEFLLIFAVMAAAAFVQSSVGFGLVLVAGPILLFVDAGFLPGPMLATALALTSLVAFRERGSIHVRGVAYAMLGRVPGTLLAVGLLAQMSQGTFDLLFGGMVLLAVALSVLGWRVEPTPGAACAAGAASGFMGTISAIGGPPLALLYQHGTGPRMRSTLAAMFVIGAILSLTALSFIGRFGVAELGRALLLFPGALAGFLASRWGTPWVDRRGLRPIVLGLSTISALAVVFRALSG